MPPSIRIVKINWFFTIKDITKIIISYLCYEDSINVYEWWKLPEPYRPIAVNLSQLYEMLAPDSNLQGIYVPKTYEGTFNLMDLHVADYARLAYGKTIYKQCLKCNKYNKLNYCFSSYEKPRDTQISLSVHLVLKRVYDPNEKRYGRIFLCDCVVEKRNGSTVVFPYNCGDINTISSVLNECYAVSPQRR